MELDDMDELCVESASSFFLAATLRFVFGPVVLRGVDGTDADDDAGM